MTDLAVYADDTTLYQCLAVGADVNEQSRVLQHAVDDLSAWVKAWKISFEPTKSQALTIDRHRPRRQLPAISFDGVPVVEEAELKLLGVQFDTQLSFHQHLPSVAVRARQRLHFLNRAAPILDVRGRERVYKGFVRPVMEYCPLVWMGAATTTLRQLDAVQLRALKIISRESWLPSLALRRAVAAHTYLYKLHCLPTSSPLRAMIPAVAPELQGHPRTRQQSRICHELQFAMPHNRHARNSVQRSFPSAIVEE